MKAILDLQDVFGHGNDETLLSGYMSHVLASLGHLVNLDVATLTPLLDLFNHFSIPQLALVKGDFYLHNLLFLSDPFVRLATAGRTTVKFVGKQVLRIHN